MKVKGCSKRIFALILMLGMVVMLGGIMHTAQPGEPAAPADQSQPQAGQAAAPAGDNVRPANDSTRRRIDPGAVEDESETNLTRPESESLYTVVLDDFERAGEWAAKMPIDQGIAKAKELWGAPNALIRAFKQQQGQGGAQGQQQPAAGAQPSQEQSGSAQQDRMRRGRAYFENEGNEPKKILGVRVDYMQRGYNWFTVAPPRPLNLDGLVKAFEVWVCGRNQRHELYIMVGDFNNEDRYIKVGMMNFIGWKRMTAPIPYTIAQSDFRKSIRRGLTFKGFLVRCHPMETSGKYYIYFDNLSVELSRFLEENRDRDDPLDVW